VLLVGLAVALIMGGIFFALNVNGPTFSRTTAGTFAVAGTPSVTIYDTAGTVTVQHGDSGHVAVRITTNVRTIDSNSAQRALDQTVVSATQNGNAINVDGHFTTHWLDGVWYDRTLDIVVTLPASSNLSAQVAAGTLDVSGVSGTFNLEANAGTITANAVTLGDGSRLSTDAGTITVSGALAAGANVRVNDETGSVTLRLPADTPARLDANVTVGSISISPWAIAVERSTVGASASGDLGANPTGTLRVTIATGNLSLTTQ
jgi:hypothetical protein